jgi:tetratricopeptide (TPR) repeat protein
LEAVKDALLRGDAAEAERLLTLLVGGDDAAATSAPEVGAALTEGLDFAEIESLYRRLIDLRERDLGPLDPALAPPLGALATLYTGAGRHLEAEALYRRALAIREGALGPDHADVAITLEGLETTLRAMGRSAEATLLAARAEAIWARERAAE